MNKKKIIIIILVVLTVILLGIFCFYTFGNKTESTPLPAIKEVDNIEKFGYVLYDNKSELYKTYFEQLKETLNKEEMDEKKYAEVIASLFVIDFYTLNNKVTNTDIGGLDFIHEEALETFKKSAQDSIYKYIESNVYGDRVQKLPEVKEISLVNINELKFESDTINDEKAYNVILKVTYQEENDYPKEVRLTLVHVQNKLYIVEVK